MASTYSDLKIELIANGEQSGSWGTTTNTNLGTAIEEAITGRAEANFASDADLTLGYTDTNGTQAFRNLILNVTGTISATRNLIVPTINKLYIVENNTTGGQDIVVKTSGGTGITVPNGVTAIVYAGGTNVVQAVDYLPTADIDGGSIDGVTIGTNSAATEVQIDNLNINGNTISSTDTNGNIVLTPDGTGEVDISKVDIASGEIDGTNIGANSAGTGNFSTLSIAGTAITSTATELNILDGATVTTGELNILDGATVTTGELNILDGVTATTAGINYLDITTLGTSEASKAVTADANGVVTFDNGTIEEATAITSSSGTATLDLQDGDNFTHTLSENVTYTFSNPASSGKASAFTLKVVQDSTDRTITWPASVDWAAATAPTLSSGSGAVDYFVFITTDGGSTFYGFTAGQALA